MTRERQGEATTEWMEALLGEPEDLLLEVLRAGLQPHECDLSAHLRAHFRVQVNVDRGALQLLGRDATELASGP